MEGPLAKRIRLATWPLRNFAPMRISQPCVGLQALRHVFVSSRVDYRAVNQFEIDSRLQRYYAGLAKTLGDESVADIVEFQDITEVPLASLVDSEGLVAGPPCVPWAGNGRRDGILNDKEAVFHTLVDWIIELAHRGKLMFVAIENSINARKYVVEKLAVLEVAVPFFVFEILQDQSSAYLPHERKRCWLRGMRLDLLVGDCIPAPLSFDIRATLHDILDTADFAPNMTRDDLSTPRRQLNYDAYMRKLDNEAVDAEFACFDVDRSICGKFSKDKLFYDNVPPLTTKGPEIFVVSLMDRDKPVQERRAHRLITNEERFRLQGFPGLFATLFDSQRGARSATGNAFPVPMVAKMVLPLMRQCAMMGAKGLTKDELNQLTSDCVRVANKRRCCNSAVFV